MVDPRFQTQGLLMTRNQIEHIKRAAKSAQAMKLDPMLPAVFAFRAVDIFAQLMTPETVIALCDEALQRQHNNESERRST
ncbi:MULTISPECIES: hypothetical protein [unclassified Caballeronia]|uniref:hypothetical protein n=1 Tax=unclassified Caballeronia TaxID=2646786 RepID=UPI002865AA2F|nr:MULTISPECIES: hypothetical protein [unclassified Caballeronia]MDR5777368.1 hypothetical protein [Caballeronia sp. LZ002]MDR5802540.1 hypothetical protein [Caballeronia sp. LZ001]MDR5852806.1 hypothetical protein [Caballeronia sp. LZ003]